MVEIKLLVGMVIAYFIFKQGFSIEKFIHNTFIRMIVSLFLVFCSIRIYYEFEPNTLIIPTIIFCIGIITFISCIRHFPQKKEKGTSQIAAPKKDFVKTPIGSLITVVGLCVLFAAALHSLMR